MKNLHLFESHISTDVWNEIIDQANITKNADGTVDYTGNVNLSGLNLKSLEDLPVKFRNISGDFNISRNKLKDFYGGPKSVSGDFDARFNLIISLIGLPDTIKGYLKLTGLFLPKRVLKAPKNLVDGEIEDYRYQMSGNMELEPEDYYTKITGPDVTEEQTSRALEYVAGIDKRYYKRLMTLGKDKFTTRKELSRQVSKSDDLGIW